MQPVGLFLAQLHERLEEGRPSRGQPAGVAEIGVRDLESSLFRFLPRRVRDPEADGEFMVRTARGDAVSDTGSEKNSDTDLETSSDTGCPDPAQRGV